MLIYTTLKIKLRANLILWMHWFFSVTSSDIQSPSVGGNTTSISLQWNEPPPRLLGSPQRSITRYEVTTVQRDGGGSQIALVTAESGVIYTVSSLHSPMGFDFRTNVVINTEGQGEQSYDIGVPPLSGEITYPHLIHGVYISCLF